MPRGYGIAEGISRGVAVASDTIMDMQKLAIQANQMRKQEAIERSKLGLMERAEEREIAIQPFKMKQEEELANLKTYEAEKAKMEIDRIKTKISLDDFRNSYAPTKEQAEPYIEDMRKSGLIYKDGASEYVYQGDITKHKEYLDKTPEAQQRIYGSQMNMAKTKLEEMNKSIDTIINNQLRKDFKIKTEGLKYTPEQQAIGIKQEEQALPIDMSNREMAISMITDEKTLNQLKVLNQYKQIYEGQYSYAKKHYDWNEVRILGGEGAVKEMFKPEKPIITQSDFEIVSKLMYKKSPDALNDEEFSKVDEEVKRRAIEKETRISENILNRGKELMEERSKVAIKTAVDKLGAMDEAKRKLPASTTDLDKYVNPNTLAKYPRGTTYGQLINDRAVQLDDKEREKFDALNKTEATINILDRYSKRIHTATDFMGASLQGAKILKEEFTKGTDASMYKAERDAYLSNAARTIGAEKGVLNEGDIRRMHTAFAERMDTKQIRDQKFAILKYLNALGTRSAKSAILGILPSSGERTQVDYLLDTLESNNYNKLNEALEFIKNDGNIEINSNKILDENTASQILQEAGGNKNKAREIAKQRGYKF